MSVHAVVAAAFAADERPFASVDRFLDAMDTVRVYIRPDEQRDVSVLRDFLLAEHDRKHRSGGSLLGDTLPFIVECALRLPELFPTGTLAVPLQPGRDPLVLSRAQTACLLAHMVRKSEEIRARARRAHTTFHA